MMSEGLSRALWWVVGLIGTICVWHRTTPTSDHRGPAAPTASAWAQTPSIETCNENAYSQGRLKQNSNRSKRVQKTDYVLKGNLIHAQYLPKGITKPHVPPTSRGLSKDTLHLPPTLFLCWHWAALQVSQLFVQGLSHLPPCGMVTSI